MTLHREGQKQEGQEQEREEAYAGTGRRRRGASRTRRRVVTVGVVAAVVAAAGAALLVRPWPRGTEDAATERPSHSTAPVQRTSLASGLRLDGELGHAPADEITAQGQGTFTKLPKTGEHVRLGGTLYEIDARPVVLFRGSRPFWRVLEKGMSDGPDVKDLERNLTDLGYANAAGLTVDEEFTDATAAAVERWQKALGVRTTGSVELGRVAVLPYGDVQVEEVVAKPGATAGAGGTVLKVTTTDVYATVKPTEDQLPQLPPGGKVTVRLDAGGSVQGKITSITRDTGQSGDGGDPGDPGGPDGETKPTVSIRLADQKKAAAALRGGRVGAAVTVPEKKADDVLVVPVTALLAMTGGGYGVEVVKPGTAEPVLVPVEVGLIVANQAEVEGRLKEGDKVVVPA
ncbi:peptidoglycan-binding protein [Streptomyces aurantiacus]|uniref:Peptidoglycan-binding protein n=1 Tax=Streptomyces aurantiacus TaxID=47760 RepID=A0A7G1P1F9_9ACTN|nr:peptidoglycan-binding protein [Streptomyces aurantiacus]BCL28842.1 peptidoglycan-binding protein [Streptomyces aurantiacus]